MIINEKYLVDYLVKTDLLAIDDLIEGYVEISKFSQKNICYSLKTSSQKYFFKQFNFDNEFNRTIYNNEVNVYSSLSKTCHLFPAFKFYDADLNLLSIEYLDTYADFFNLVKNSDVELNAILENLFKNLQKVHSLDLQKIKEPLVFKNWAFYIFSNFENYYKPKNEETKNLIEHIQNNTLLKANFEALNKMYSFKYFILGDLRIKNILINKTNNNELKFIDLEYAGKGDPVTDIASLIVSCLFYFHSKNKDINLKTKLTELLELATSSYTLPEIVNGKNYAIKLNGFIGIHILRFALEVTGNNRKIETLRGFLDLASELIINCQNHHEGERLYLQSA